MKELRFTKMKHDTPFLKRALWEVHNGKCFYCGKELMVKEVEIDHIWPQKENSTFKEEPYVSLYKNLLELGFEKETLENYAASCRTCNNQKRNSLFVSSSYHLLFMRTFRKRDEVLNRVIKYQTEWEATVEDNNENDNNEKKIGEMEKQKDLLAERHTINTRGSLFYVYGKGHACIRAFIPTDYETRMGCNINTEELNKSEITYTLAEEDIKKYLFNGSGNELQKRMWCQKFEDELNKKSYQIILPNLRVDASYDEVSELASIVDDFFEEYQMQESRIKKILGIERFTCTEYNRVEILTISKALWEKIKEFSYEHTCDKELSEWNIFNIINQRNKIQLCPNDNEQKEQEYWEFIPVILVQFVAEEDNNRMHIYWEPGFGGNENDKMIGFDNLLKWKADYSHDWMKNQLIPYILFQTLPLIEMIKYKDFKNEKFLNKYILNNTEIISHMKESLEETIV